MIKDYFSVLQVVSGIIHSDSSVEKIISLRNFFLLQAIAKSELFQSYIKLAKRIINVKGCNPTLLLLDMQM